MLAEETDAAYDRVGLTGYTEHWDRSLLALAGNDYGGDDLVELRLGSRVTASTAPPRQCSTAAGVHRLRRAGAGHRLLRVRPACAGPRSSEVPRLPHARRPRRDPRGRGARGRGRPRRPWVWLIGGGLLGLEAANALRQFGLQTHVVEIAPRLMAQQLDEAGGALLGRMIADFGISVHSASAPRSADSNRPVRGPPKTTRCGDAERRILHRRRLVVFAAGVRPRDELARAVGVESPSVAACSPIYPVPLRIPTSTRWARSRRSKVAATDWSGPATPAPKSSPIGCWAAPPSSQRRHVDQAQAARRRRGQFRRRDGGGPELPRGGRQRRSESIYAKLVLSDDSKTLLGGILVGDARPTACCGRWSANRCPVTRWR